MMNKGTPMDEADLPDTDEDEARPWERPGQVRRDVEPDRGLLLLIVGWVGASLAGLSFLLQGVAILAANDWFLWASLFFSLAGLPVGLFAWGMACHDLGEMQTGALDPAGKKAAKRALFLGVLTFGACV